MKKPQQNKTNAMRILDQVGISYDVSEYEYDESDLSGTHAAKVLGVDPDQMFKTLVTRGNDGELFVFVLPVSSALDLRKAAKEAGKKSVSMIHVREIQELTGYIRGGCSPVGMKKQFPTFIDETAVLFERIYVSAGKRGVQIVLNPDDLAGVTGAVFCDLTE